LSFSGLGQDPSRSTSVTVGGSGLDWHDVDSYFRRIAFGRYSFDDQNDIAFNIRTAPRKRRVAVPDWQFIASFLQTAAWETVQKYYGRDTTN
jgi:hypothetical protein